MGSVFKITRAEFAKIFKKPTVYIMAFVLVLTCVLSLFLFSPTQRQDYRVKLSDEYAISNYNIFMSDIGSDNKTNYDTTIKETDDKINYFLNLQNRSDVYYDSMDNLINALKSQSTESPKEKTEILKELENLISYYTYDYGLSEVNYFNLITTLKSESSVVYYTENVSMLTQIKNELSALSTPEEITEYLTTNNTVTKLQNIYKDYINYVPVILNNIVIELEETHNAFITAVQQNSTQQSVQLTTLQKTKLRSIYNLIKKYDEVLNAVLNTDYPIAIILKDNYNDYLKAYSRVEKIVNVTDTDLDKFSVRQACAEELSVDTYITQFKLTNNDINYLNVINEKFTEALVSTQNSKNTNIEVIYNKILQYKDDDISTTNICNEITNYKLLSLTYSQNITDKINSIITNDLSLSDITNLYNYDFENFSKYELAERISVNDYYLNTNTYSTNYLQTFNFNSNSDYKTNMFDYMYFALKICTLLIIIFTMFMVASIISSEQDNGTIKLLLVRPFSRGKILSAKLLATFFFSLCFMLFCCLITLVGGVLVYGLPTLSSVLVTFNATTTFAINPFILMLIFVLTCLLDIIFYLIISATLSVVFKSYIGSITTSMIIIIVATVLSALLPNTVVYTFLPFTSLNLFRFLGNGFLPTGSSIINLFFLNPISPSMTIWTSLLVNGIFGIIMYIIAFTVFKRRDF